MAQRYVGWCSVHTNGVTLRRIALQNIRRSSCTLNCLALHEIFRCRGESSSLLVAWREGYLAETTRNKNRKWNSDLLEGMTSSNVKIDAKPLCTWCSRCFEESSLRLVVKQSQFVTFWYVLFFSPGDIAIIRCCPFGVPRIVFAIKAFRYHFDWKMSKNRSRILVLTLFGISECFNWCAKNSVCNSRPEPIVQNCTMTLTFSEMLVLHPIALKFRL